MIHCDVMDGQFVPNITFGPKMVADVRRRTALPLDTHLMIERPEQYVGLFAEAGADYLCFHLEAAVHAHRILQQIRSLGMKAGISIVPSTPAEVLGELLDELDLILVMTVNPGFGGQSLIPRCVEKVRALAAMRSDRGLEFLISVDGGVNGSTAPGLRDAGADVMVTGSAFFSSDDPRSILEELRGPKVV
jgi:ribulose-phosphate 3-epimerase